MSWITNQLIREIKVISKNRNDPVIVYNIPDGWSLLGKGNSAAVFTHPLLQGKVVKVYAENRVGIEEEILVYKMLGVNKAYSRLHEYNNRFLVLDKLDGITLFQAFKNGIFIPQTVIEDVDKAIDYAKEKGLNPTDIHGKNVIMKNGKGYIVDVSDFLKPYECPKWKHFKKMYYFLYIPLFKRYNFSLPFWFLERVRKCYQYYLLLSGFRKVQESYNKKT